MLRILLAKGLGIAALLAAVWPGEGIADDSSPQAKATSPATMSCADYANSHSGPAQSGLTTPTFNVSSYSIVAAPKSGTDICATIDFAKMSVTKDVSSYYWV